MNHTGIALSGGGGSATFWGAGLLLLLTDTGGRSDVCVLRQPRHLYHKRVIVYEKTANRRLSAKA